MAPALGAASCGVTDIEKPRSRREHDVRAPRSPFDLAGDHGFVERDGELVIWNRLASLGWSYIFVAVVTGAR